MNLKGKEARDGMLKGIREMGDIVGGTLGPLGRSVIVSAGGLTGLTDDGVTVARFTKFSDPVEALGSVVVVKSAEEGLIEGDGTTTASVAASAMCQAANELIDAGKAPAVLVREIKEALEVGLKALEAQHQALPTDEAEYDKVLENIATVSSNGDREMGTAVARAVAEAKVDGIVLTNDEKGTTDSVTWEIQKGLQVHGFRYSSKDFINNHKNRSVVINKPYIILTKRELTHKKEVDEVIKICGNDWLAKGGTSAPNIVFICDRVNKNASLESSLRLNLPNGTANPNLFSSVIIETNGIQYRDELMDDVRAFTGGRIVRDDKNPFEGFSIDWVGFCDQVVVTEESTTFVGIPSEANQDIVDRRVGLLKEQLKGVLSDGEKLSIQKRISRLSNGLVSVNIVYTNDMLGRKKKDLVDDAIHATKSAMRSGYVVGGGHALLRTTLALPDTDGGKVLEAGVKEPFTRILKNAGFTDEQIMEYTNRSIKNNTETDPFTGEVSDFLGRGIIDPYFVASNALKAATNAAVTFSNTGAILILDNI